MSNDNGISRDASRGQPARHVGRLSRIRHFAVLLVLWACLSAGAAVAQEGPAPRPIRPFAVTDFMGEVYVEGTMERRNETTGTTRLRETQTLFQEGLRLQAQGYVYHPNLFEWFGLVDLARIQQDVTVNNVSSPSVGTLKSYNLSGLVLKEKPVSLRGFASASSSLISREFLTPVTVDNTRDGGELFTKGKFPMHLLLEHVTQHETSDIRTDDQKTDHALFSITDRRRAEGTTEFTWDHEKTAESETFPGGSSLSLPTLKDDLGLTTYQQFGENKSQLTGQFRWLDRSGFFTEQARSADVGLDLNHTQTLSTFYRALYNQDQTDTETTTNTEGEVGFRKKIYESLDITGRLRHNDQTFLDGFDDRDGGFIDFDYHKRTGLGELSSILNLGLEREHEASGTSNQLIQNEAVTLVGTTLVPLAHTGVIVGSISVNRSNPPVPPDLDLNADYTLTVVGSIVKIARVDGGQIQTGDTVFVTYSVTVPRDAVWKNETVNWLNHLKIKGTPFGLFYNYLSLDQELTSGSADGILDTVRDHIFGADFDYRGVTAAYEHEIRDQILSPPARADRFRVNYLSRIGRDTDLMLGGQISRLNYLDAQRFNLQPGRDFIDTAGVFGRVSTRLRENLLLNLNAEYNRDRGQQNDELARVTAQLLWQYHQLEFQIEAKESLYTREMTRGTEESLYFKVKRKF